MATLRNEPYGRFNFLVEWDGLDGNSVQGGFAEVSGLDAEVCMTEYRAGNDVSNSIRKIPGLTQYANVHLKRGLIGSTDLFDWFKEISNGANHTKHVTIILLDEERNPVYHWRLRNAKPMSYRGARLEATLCAVAIEELVLTHEGLLVE
jgi:phage tail-like protein